MLLTYYFYYLLTYSAIKLIGDPASNLAQVQFPPHSSFSPRDFQSNLNVFGYGLRRVFKELHSWEVIMWRKISEIRRYLHKLHVNQDKNSIENWPAPDTGSRQYPRSSSVRPSTKLIVTSVSERKVCISKNNKLPTLTAYLGIHKGYLQYFLKYLG